MKKFALVALFSVAAFGMAFATQEHGTSKSGSLEVQATVSEVFSLVVPADYHNTVDNTKSSETWSIGNVVVTSNVKNWTVSLSSENKGVLVLSTDSAEKIPYKVTLGSMITNASLGDGSKSTPATSSAQERTPKTGDSYPLSMSLGSDSFFQAGNYDDTITVTISHN